MKGRKERKKEKMTLKSIDDEIMWEALGCKGELRPQSAESIGLLAHLQLVNINGH